MQQRLSDVDSNAAKTLFAGSQQRYAALSKQIQSDTGSRKSGFSGQYLPYADTLRGAMNFLQQHPQLLAAGASPAGAVSGVPGSLSGANQAAASISPKIQAKLQGATSQFQTLQAKLQDADEVKAYVQSRQQQISQYIAQHANVQGLLGKQLAGMSQGSYYYAQRVQQYKAMLSNPTQLAQLALSQLSRLPAFQAFMSKNSQLGSLFHLPGSYASPKALNGLQSKAQVAQIVQAKVSAAGPAGASAMQSNLQSAQSQLDSYKDKLSKLGLGGGDMAMPNFSANNTKTKSLLQRLQFGFNFQTTHNSYYYPTLIDLGLSLAYQLGHNNSVGVGASYKIGLGNGINDISLTGNGVGLRSFLNIKIKGSFSATGGFEYNYTTPFTSYQQLREIQYWTRSGLLGITKTISTKSKVFKQTTLSLLWDFLSYQQVPQTQAFLFRIGYNF